MRLAPRLYDRPAKGTALPQRVEPRVFARAAHPSRSGRGWARGRGHPIAIAHRSLQAAGPAGDAPPPAVAGAVRHPMGQAAPDAAICRELLPGARRIHARGAAYHATLPNRQSVCTKASRVPTIMQARSEKIEPSIRTVLGQILSLERSGDESGSASLDLYGAFRVNRFPPLNCHHSRTAVDRSQRRDA